MLIEEHLKGTIYIPIHNGDESYRIIEHDFTENDVIHNSCSITSRCCDDKTFSIGGVRPAELSIKLRIKLPDVNAYTLYGAKIRLYSRYFDNPWMLRGEFWVTSAKRTKNIYTIRASDALIWLDSGSYASEFGQTSKPEDNPIYKKFTASMCPSSMIWEEIFKTANADLESAGIDKLKYEIREDVPNWSTTVSEYNNTKFGYCLIGTDNAGSCASRSPRDYASYMAQIAAGCVQVLVSPDEPENAKIYVTPYGYSPNHIDGKNDELFIKSWEEPVKIGYEEIELDSCDIADYELYVHMTYVKTYDETGWSCGGIKKKYQGNLVVDFSGNPFLDGRWSWKDELGLWDYEKPSLVFGVLVKAGEQLGSIAKRPFSLKCYHAFKSLAELPKLGQRIEIEEKPGTWKESFITKMIWHFRGGWEFGCAGSDSRVLSQAAKKVLQAMLKIMQNRMQISLQIVLAEMLRK